MPSGTKVVDIGQFTVVGIAPPGFEGTFTLGQADFWAPMTMVDTFWTMYRDFFDDRRALFMFVYGRLAPGVTATAVVVGPVEEGTGYLGGKTVHSADTCGAVCHTAEFSDERGPWLRLRPQKAAAKLLRETSEPHLLECCHGALEVAGKKMEDIDFLAVNSPLAWYPEFARRALGVDSSRTLSCYPLYSNIGPELLGTNLFHAVAWGKIRPGDLVMLYTVGSVSSCSAAVVRWGDVGLGPEPAGTSEELLEELRNQPVPEIAPPLADPAAISTAPTPPSTDTAP